MENQVKALARRFVSTAAVMSVTVLLLASTAEAQDPPLPSSQTASAAQMATPDDQVAPAAAPAPAAQEFPEPAPTGLLSNMRIRGYGDVTSATRRRRSCPRAA